MTACMQLMHEDCRTGHITVGGTDNDLRNALAIASDRIHRRQSRALSVASRAGVSLQTQGKCGLGRLRCATDGPGPGGRQRRRGGELGAGNSASWHLHRWCTGRLTNWKINQPSTMVACRDSEAFECTESAKEKRASGSALLFHPCVVAACVVLPPLPLAVFFESAPVRVSPVPVL